MFITLIDEREEKAYSEIQLMYAKEKGTNIFNVYFNTLIRHKMIKLIPNRKRIINDIKMKEDIKLLKEKYALRVLASVKIPITLTDFCLTVKHSLEPELDECIKWGKERSDVIKSFLDFFCDTISQYRIDVFNCIDSNTKMVNLVLLMYWCGPIYRIDDYKLLKKDKVVNKKVFSVKLKEFFIKYEEENKTKLNIKTNRSHSSSKRGRRRSFCSFDSPAIPSKEDSYLNSNNSSLDNSMSNSNDIDSS